MSSIIWTSVALLLVLLIVPVEVTAEDRFYVSGVEYIRKVGENWVNIHQKRIESIIRVAVARYCSRFNSPLLLGEIWPYNPLPVTRNRMIG